MYQSEPICIAALRPFKSFIHLPACSFVLAAGVTQPFLPSFPPTLARPLALYHARRHTAGLLQTDAGTLDGCSLQRGGGGGGAVAEEWRGSVCVGGWGVCADDGAARGVQEEPPLGWDIPPTLRISRLLSVSVLRLLPLLPRHKTSDQLHF